jgi:hypothetical protein
MSDHRFGITVAAHVKLTMADAEAVIASAFSRIRDRRPLAKIEREALNRQLAGVVGGVETIRIWLQSGAPQ